MDLKTPFSFAVVSDTHFVRREYKNNNKRLMNALDADAYIENVTYALAPMMDALREMAPNFLVITGDIIEPGDPDTVLEDVQAALSFFSTCDIPILYARGNLDDPQAFAELIRPQMATLLNLDLHTNYFSFAASECLFICLDSPDWSDEQAQWLEKTLQASQEGAFKHIFVFGHHPVWPVTRAFFTPLTFRESMVQILDRFDVDAYFCGHTHNQNVVWHRTQGLPVFQFMGAMIGESDEPPVALNQVHSVMLDSDEVLAIWPGYLENTAPGWYMVSVAKNHVIAEWHHLNRGAEAVVAFEKPGEIIDVWLMEQIPPAKLIPMDLGQIRRAFLRFCVWDGEKGVKASINGRSIGELPPRDGFAPARLEIPGNLLDQLQVENRLVIEVPEGCELTVGNLILEVLLPGGRVIRTPATGELFSWSEKWLGWKRETLQVLKPQEKLRTMLIFE